MTRAIKTLADLPQLPAGPHPRSRIVVARLGKYHDSRYGNFAITEADYQGWKHNLSETFGGQVSVDFDHSSDRGRGTAAAGWIVGLEREGKDVIADVEWTPKGAAAVRDKTYRHVSPTFTSHYVDEFGKDRGRALLGAATTNRPVLRSLPTLSLSRDSIPGVATPRKKGKSMSKKQKAKKLARKAERKRVKKLRKQIKALAAPSYPGLRPGSNWGDPTSSQAHTNTMGHRVVALMWTRPPSAIMVLWDRSARSRRGSPAGRATLLRPVRPSAPSALGHPAARVRPGIPAAPARGCTPAALLGRSALSVPRPSRRAPARVAERARSA